MQTTLTSYLGDCKSLLHGFLFPPTTSHLKAARLLLNLNPLMALLPANKVPSLPHDLEDNMGSGSPACLWPHLQTLPAAHSGLLAIPWKCQAGFNLKRFVFTVLSACNILSPDTQGLMPLFLLGCCWYISLLESSFLIRLCKITIQHHHFPAPKSNIIFFTALITTWYSMYLFAQILSVSPF